MPKGVYDRSKIPPRPYAAPVQESVLRALNKYPDGLTPGRLIEEVYGAKEPDTALSSLYVAVWKLRKNMGIQIHFRDKRYTMFP